MPFLLCSLRAQHLLASSTLSRPLICLVSFPSVVGKWNTCRVALLVTVESLGPGMPGMEWVADRFLLGEEDRD